MTRDGISWLTREISKLGGKVFPTHTNFFLVDVGGDAKLLYNKMLTKGVIVRAMNAYGYPSYIRITVGLSTENKRLVKALAETLEEMRNG